MFKTLLAAGTLAALAIPAIAQTTPALRDLSVARDRPALHDLALASGTMVEAEAITLGDLTISNPFSRATLPNAPVGGGFLTITNDGSTDDRLIAASSPAAGRVEIHEMAMQGDVMKMRELPDGLPIPAGETLTLEPGGFHLMMMKLKHPLAEGDTVAVTLTFEQAGEITVALPIGAPNARGHAGHMDHGATN